MRANAGLTTLVAAAATLIGLGAPGPLRAERESSIPKDPSDLLVVDCLLPGQTRKLGKRTFLTQRRPIKTTASDCGIRGGEYVAYDRANYATALGVWLPQAEAGDAQAQAYVGEIFEKGLGRPTDYAQAAAWYEKAAAQNYTRAQMNLAYLYEQGLGVTRDPRKALNLYRQASGITDDSLTYVSEVTALQKEIDELTAQLEQQNTEIDRLKVEVDSGQSQITIQRDALARAQGDANKLRSEISQLRSRPTADPAQVAALRQLENELRTRELKLLEEERSVAGLEATTAENNARLVDQLNVAARKDLALRQQLQQTAAARDELQQKLDDTQLKLLNAEQQAAQLGAQLTSERAGIAAARESLAKRPATATPTEVAERQRLVADLAARERKMTTQQAQITSLLNEKNNYLAELTRLREEQQTLRAQRQTDAQLAAAQQVQQQEVIENVRLELASTQRRLMQTDQRVTALNAELASERRSIAASREQLTRSPQSPEITTLRADLVARETELVKRQKQIEWLVSQRNLDRQRIAKLQALPPGPAIATTRSAAGVTRTPGPLARSLPKALQSRSYHALLIGNNEYLSEEFEDLKSAAADAQAVDQVLRQRYGFKTKLLIDATRLQMIQALVDYQKSLTEDDSLLIYYAGHGDLREAREPQSYWLPVDAQKDSPAATWISGDQLTDQINLMRARHVLVVADSCYQGVMTRETSVGFKAVEGEAAQIRELTNFAKLHSRTVLTSGGEKPVLDSGGGAHSIFAQVFLRVLRENDRVLVGKALHNALSDDVRRAAAPLNVDQSPRYAGLADAGHVNAADFLFIPVS